ncbi:hypothetical protein VTI28DRAFT_9853 [Corynascus sepedonium]
MISTNCKAAVDIENAVVPSAAIEIDQSSSRTLSNIGNTLLPGPVANLVSFATRSTCLAVRVTSAIGGSGLDAARFTTLSTLKVGRTIMDGVLSRAGKDTALIRSGANRTDTEAGVESIIEKLHNKADLLIFWTAAGFQLANTALSTFSEGSQLVLSTLDRFFGSTDSSRAMASIIAMIRREIANPPMARPGETVGVSDLVAALCALAFLQRSCKSILEEEKRNPPIDEVVWDIVVLNDGMRVDISEEMLKRRLSRSIMPSNQQELALDDAPTRQLEYDIVQSLPNNAKVSITRELAVSETITVDFTGDVQQINVKPPPGIELIEENRNHGRVQAGKENTTTQYVFRNTRRHKRRLSYQKTNDNTNHVADPGVGLELLVSDCPVDRIADTYQPQHEVESMAKNGPSKSESRLYLAPPPSQPSNQLGLLAQERFSKKPLDSASKREYGSYPSSPETKRPPRNVLRRSSSRFNKKDTASEAAAGKAKSTFVASLAAKFSGKLDRRPADINQQSLFDREGRHNDLEPGPSLISYCSVHESRRQSTVSLGGSILTTDDFQSTSLYTETAGSREMCEADLGVRPEDGYFVSARNHHRSKSNTSSIHTLATNKSEVSLVSCHQSTALTFSPADKLSALRQSGALPGMFPERHFLGNAARYMRFASASYGSHFLKVLGIGTELPRPGIRDDTHHELRSFAHHTRSNPSDILIASFVDPQGGSDATGSTNTGVPLVHYISLDHESQAVVLACRGTLGFEDVLADMTCDYDELAWQGNSYKVHKGVHASAKRLLHGGDGRVLRTLQAALEEFPTYGLVLTGHSLGAAVTSLLGIMLSEPVDGVDNTITTTTINNNDDGHRTFVTASSYASSSFSASSSSSYRRNTRSTGIPPNRPIQVYAYGPPATVCPALRAATRGLITTLVHGNDIVPFLSLGTLHDVQGAALSLKTDAAQGGPAAKARRRILKGVVRACLATTTSDDPDGGGSAGGGHVRGGDGGDENRWGLDLLGVLRRGMRNEKLVPPGEVFVVEGTVALLRGNKGGEKEEEGLGRPARRMVLRYVKDVERRFGELRFGMGMLTDHSPARYEAALERLVRGLGVRE